jgi:hypothetical protein
MASKASTVVYLTVVLGILSVPAIVPIFVMSSFEDRVRELCAQVVACETEEETIILARQLHSLIHEHIEELRGKLATLPLVKNPLDTEVA